MKRSEMVDPYKQHLLAAKKVYAGKDLEELIAERAKLQQENQTLKAHLDHLREMAQRVVDGFKVCPADNVFEAGFLDSMADLEHALAVTSSVGEK